MISLSWKIKLPITLILAVISLSFAGCAKSAPDCNAKKTKDLVIQIAKDEFSKLSAIARAAYGETAAASIESLLKSTNYDVINIRTTNFNKEIGKYECAADLKTTNKEGEKINPITYTSELVDGGKDFYVSVSGLI